MRGEAGMGFSIPFVLCSSSIRADIPCADLRCRPGGSEVSPQGARMTIKVILHEVAGADARQLGLARRAAAALERALNHPEFAGRVAAAPYKETRFSDGARDCSIAPSEIEGIIASGAERGTEADAEIDLRIRVAPLPEGVVGETTPGTLPFRTARWFLEGCRHQEDVVTLARHFIHEWLHVAG